MIQKLTIPHLDGGGVPIFNYERKPFTGIVFENEDDGSLSWEEEYIDGFQEGWYKSFHKTEKLNNNGKHIIPMSFLELTKNGTKMEI